LIQQLIFDLPADARLTRDDFCVSPASALALAAVDAWRTWPNHKMLLIGPEGAGKSHLAQIWANDAQAVLLPAAELAGADIPALATASAVGVEDAETLGGDPAAEAALFHLHNLLATSGSLLVTANAPPRDWGLTLPDLASRMQAAPLTRLAPPDDALLTAVLAKLFADHQLSVSPNLIAYLVVRMDRSIAAARRLVDTLDAHALAQHRPITRAMAGKILDGGQPE
jgi:chromosomal replication initiation ATPase DnaA